MKAQKISRGKLSLARHLERVPAKEELEFREMAECIFQPAEHPYQRSMVETLILLLEVGDLGLIFSCFRLLFRAALMHRSYDQARYWAGQGRIIAMAMGDPGRMIQIWTWAAEVEKETTNYEKALDCLQRALAYAYKYSHPSQFDVYEHIAKCFFYVGRIEEAGMFHEKAAMCQKQPPEGLLRTSTLKLQNQPLGPKNSTLKADLLNELWLPISSNYHSHFQSQGRTERPLLERLKLLRGNIREYYDSKTGIVLAQGIYPESSEGQSLYLMYGGNQTPMQPILLSHKTHNKNIDMFMTQESVVPKINKMLKELEQSFLKYIRTANPSK